MGCMRRRSARYLGAHFAILAMLFSQLALATYAAAGIAGAVALLIGFLAAAVLAIGWLGVYRRSLGEAAR